MSGPDRPLGDQYRRANVVIVVAQEADVDIEVLDEVGQHPLTHLDRGGRVHRHQLGGDGRDDQLQAAWHVILRIGVSLRGDETRCSPRRRLGTDGRGARRKPEYQHLRLVGLGVGQLAEIVLQIAEVPSESRRQFAEILVVVCIEKRR